LVSVANMRWCIPFHSIVIGVFAGLCLATGIVDVAPAGTTKRDCDDFNTRGEAQLYFESKGGSSTDNIDMLDEDGDGRVGESHPTGTNYRTDEDAEREFRMFIGFGILATAVLQGYIMIGRSVSKEAPTLPKSTRPLPPVRSFVPEPMTHSPEQLHSMPYDEYLRTHHWRATRASAIQRAEGRCQVCNRVGPRHVHHRTYERLGQERDMDLTVLCASCHDMFHRDGRMPDRTT